MRYGARRGLAPTAVLTAALATGCTVANPEPAAEPPEFPPAAKKDSEQGATTFATHWMDLVEHGRKTLNADPLRELGLPSCRTCARLIAQLDSDKAAGKRYEGGDIRTLSAQPSQYAKGENAKVGVVFDERELKVFDRSGEAIDTLPRSTLLFVFDLKWTDAGWRAAHVRLATDEQPRKPK